MHPLVLTGEVFLRVVFCATAGATEARGVTEARGATGAAGRGWRGLKFELASALAGVFGRLVTLASVR